MRCTTLSLLTVLLACSATGPSEVWQAQLDAARQRWAANGPSEYEYTYVMTCYCPPESLRPVLVRVRNGEVIALYYGNFPGGELPSYEGDWTIPEQFARIQRYIDGGAKALEVEYHPVTGVPISMSVDPIPNAVDDEHGFTITSFGDIPSPAQR
jgi:hypothetical protein